MELVCPSGCFSHGDEDLIDATLATAQPLGYSGRARGIREPG